jgi:predicted outer membrane protein
MKLGALAAVASFVFVGYAAAQQTEELRERQLERSGVQAQSERSATTEQQQLQTEERRAGYRGAGQAGQSQKLDKYLASCLLIKNKAEVELSRFGAQQAENPQVKQFAQMLVEDHQQMIPKLEQIAGGQAGQSSRQRVGAAGQTDAQRTRQDADTQRTAQDATTRSEQEYGSAGSDITQQLQQIDKQITQRCLEMTKEKLQEKQGAEFDKAFVGCQIGAHIDSLAALEVIQQQSSGQLAQVAQQASQTVEQHLQQAEQLMQQLEGQQGGQTRQGRQSQPTRTER